MDNTARLAQGGGCASRGEWSGARPL